MEINVSPKQQFLAMEQMASEFRNLVTRNTVQTAATYAVAEMNFTGKFNSDQMSAVHVFLRTFLNLGELPPEPKKYPSKTLREPPAYAGRSKPKTETI